MTIARRLILDRIKVALEGIDGTGVYVSTVDTVHRHARTWNETRFDDRISVCIAPRLETYRYQPANMLRVEFIVDLLAFVNAATDSEDARINAINDLLDDIIAARPQAHWAAGAGSDRSRPRESNLAQCQQHRPTSDRYFDRRSRDRRSRLRRPRDNSVVD